MSSESDYQHAESSQESSDNRTQPPTRPSSRRQSRTPLTPRKRRRLESVDRSRVRRLYLKSKYNDAYRVLFNDDVRRAAARFKASETFQHYTTQIGASIWSAKEQAMFFAALERLGRDDVPGIAAAVGTKSVPETRELLLLLEDAAIKQGDANVTLRDIPAAIEVGSECSEQLDLAGEALAWQQEVYEASQEQEKFGDYWLITSAIAGRIEDEIDPGRSRVGSSAPPSGADTPRRGGRVHAGACTPCRISKRKCDRETTCANCERRNLECEYAQAPIRTESTSGTEVLPVARVGDNMLDAVPEARLLQADVMLTLSRKLFMNRSPTIPSPWPHWSEYTSDFTDEPAIYRSAFNDLHTLVISVTKRLMQTAIIQATSRLRSQRKRADKGVLPLVRRRDVLTAIDIVGLKRNGQERWRGVARRCGLHVIEGRYKSKKEVPWDEVESIMKRDDPAFEPLLTDVETSGNEDPSQFKRRAARSGTPLPIEQLALSDTDEDLYSSSESDADEHDSDDSMLSEIQHSFERRVPQPRDPLGKYASVPPMSTHEEFEAHPYTLERFDQEASREEEQMLWKLLGLQPPVKADEVEVDECSREDSLEGGEKVITDNDGWRSWTKYEAEWETFRTPLPPGKFISNQKSTSLAPIVSTKTLSDNNAGSDGNDHAHSNQSISQRKQHAPQGVELRAQGSRAYAALRGRVFETANSDSSIDNGSSDVDAESYPERDQPAQSIETANEQRPAVVPNDEMDWEAFLG